VDRRRTTRATDRRQGPVDRRKTARAGQADRRSLP
jgi:hypothetical protein